MLKLCVFQHAFVDTVLLHY